jgi:V8-like Glu-specific endopeptidase
MCLDEKFSHQPSLSYACTGFLIGEDLLLTAGHCSTNVEEVFSSSEFYCEAYTWMFDYHEHKKGKTNVSAVSGDNIYRCKEIIYAVSNNSEPHRDFALIRLDRKVTDRTPLKLASKDPRKNESVFMLGHPMGMPMKLTNNARVVHNDKQKNFFTTNLDAFSGNSGSPVFNRKKEVVGILVAGNPANSTYYDEKNKCERYNRCDNNGKNCKAITIEGEGFPNTGSDVQKITPYLELINRS